MVSGFEGRGSLVVRCMSRRYGLAALLCLSLCMLSVTAWAGQDVVILLDGSAAMTQGDPQQQGMRALTAFINGQGPGTRVALLTFAAQPRRVVSFTPLDAAGRRQVDVALGNLRFAGARGDVSMGLERALAEIIDHGNPQAAKSIVLITSSGIATAAAAGRDAARWILRSLVPAANFNQVRVFSVVRAPAGQDTLSKLAQETGGAFFSVAGPGDYAAALHNLAPQLTRPALASVTLPLPSAAAALPLQFATPLTRVAQPGPEFHWWWLVALFAVVIAMVVIYALWSLRTSRVSRSRPVPAAPPGSGAHAVLYDISNPNEIRRFELDERAILLGRVAGYDPDVQYILIKEKTVGRCHAVIERRGHTFWLTDQGSVNGTFVNGERISADYALKHGDVIAVHKHEFEFMIPEYFETDVTVVGAREAAAV